MGFFFVLKWYLYSMKSFIKQSLREGLGVTLYHGSMVEDIKNLRAGRGQYGFGVYITTSQQTASSYGFYVYDVLFLLDNNKAIQGLDRNSIAWSSIKRLSTKRLLQEERHWLRERND